MGALRFFVSGVYAPGDEAPLATSDVRKLLTVLRKTSGADLEIVDSSGRLFAASLRVIGTGAVAEVRRELAAPPAARLRITLAQGLPKGAKMDYVVEKASELGVERVVVFTSDRSTPGGPRDGKIERWRRVAESAARQCGRTDRLEVEGPIDFTALTARVRDAELALVPWELAAAGPLRDRLPALLGASRRAIVVIGPEGGLSEAEARGLESCGAHLVSLGNRILRTETAGLVACAALAYASGDI